MFSKSLILFASITAASALAVGPTPDVGSTVTVCSDVNGVSGCVNIPINSDDCRSFTGGLSFLNDEVSAAKVPAGFGGSWNFLAVPGISGTVDFNDRSSSFTCSTF
ncbi:hypothetical protein C8J57DRAFT_1529706 [Mycena rebaudengoi]|nr:hypothetical protein C8J57DRAFT_1529706 [Mycena rebaudengoi]